MLVGLVVMASLLQVDLMTCEGLARSTQMEDWGIDRDVNVRTLSSYSLPPSLGLELSDTKVFDP